MKKYIFINGVNDYDVEISEDRQLLSLFYSSDGAWNNPNEFIMSLKNTGNGFQLKNAQKRKNYLEYDEALELNILLKIYYLLDNYKIEMVDKVIEL